MVQIDTVGAQHFGNFLELYATPVQRVEGAVILEGSPGHNDFSVRQDSELIALLKSHQCCTTDADSVEELRFQPYLSFGMQEHTLIIKIILYCILLLRNSTAEPILRFV